jgi:hypothetical protein
MKRTDQERIERELKRREKKTRVATQRDDQDISPGGYIDTLVSLLHHDGTQIFNATDDEDVMELLLSMKEDLEEKHWDGVLRGAIRKTKVAQKDLAFTELKSVLADC